MTKKNTAFLFIFATALILGGLYLTREWFQKKSLEGPEAPETMNLETLKSHSGLPSSLNIEMTFYTQAPHGNWDYPWQEACEEASVVLAANLYQNLDLNVDEFNQELLQLVDWEMETFGAYEHTSVDQTLQMMETQYGLSGVVHQDPSFEDIQKILAEGHVIIAPFAGKLLGNPNFRNGGPVYHMLVIKGYDANKQQIVTHDVGTRNGANYVYDWSTIQEALHDWHPENILLGEQKFIEVLPE